MNQKGQSLIEALVALGAAVIIVSAITIAVITAVSNSDFAKYQNLATGFAQQGIQFVEQQSQLDWVDIATYDGRFCLPQEATDLYLPETPSCSSINVADKFARDVTFVKVSPSCSADTPCCTPNPQYEAAADADPAFCTPTHHSELCSSQVTVAVSWTDSKCPTDSSSSNYYCHNVTLDTCIANINTQ
jgi:type II secretory pathway pseudopilin PulG